MTKAIIPVVNGRAVTPYQREKTLGIRRENGAAKLKKLNSKHMTMISMHLAGARNSEIADHFGCTQSRVSLVLTDPLAKEVIARALDAKKMELDALAGTAIDAVREGLRDGGMNTKLRAVNVYSKLRDSLTDKDKGTVTAEDVIARMLDTVASKGFHYTRIEGQNVQVNTGDRHDGD